MKPCERTGLHLGAEPANDDHFRVCGWIVAHLAFIEAGAADRSVFDQHRADLASPGVCSPRPRLLDREPHEMEILGGGHAGLDATVMRLQAMVQ